MPNALTRRRFLAASAVTGGTTLLAPKLAFATPEDPTQGDAVVVVFLRGGADGLSLVAPFNDSGYRSLRPDIRVLAPGEAASLNRPVGAEALRLSAGGDRFFSSGFDGFFGLHPQLKGLYDGVWAQNRLAVIPACGLPGYESSTRSHFEAQEFWERGSANNSYRTGLMARHLAVMGANGVLPAMNSDTAATTLMRGPVRRLSISDLGNFGVSGFSSSRLVNTNVLTSLYAGRSGGFDDVVNGVLPAVDAVQDVDPNATANLPRNGAVYPSTTFGRRLRHVAVLLRQNLGLKAAQVDLGGWDLHADMGFPEDTAAPMARRAKELNDGLVAFFQDLGSQLNEVTVIVITEFGRTARQNGSGGTDHGRGGVVFVAGGGIRGGVYGDFPDAVGQPDIYTVPVITDYRLAFAEVLLKRVGNQNVGQVFPTMQATPYLDLVRG